RDRADLGASRDHRGARAAPTPSASSCKGMAAGASRARACCAAHPGRAGGDRTVSLFETILGIHGSNRPASTDERQGGVPDALALAALLDAVGALLSRYVVFRSTAQRTAVVLWIAHAHALEAFDVTPYLNVRSAEKRSGKTRLLETLTELVPSPWPTV